MRRWVFFILFILVNLWSWGQFNTIAPGNWTDGAIWSTGTSPVLPLNNSIVTIMHNVSLATGTDLNINGNANVITIQGGNLTIQDNLFYQANSGGSNVQVLDTLTIEKDLFADANSQNYNLMVEPSGVVRVFGNWDAVNNNAMEIQGVVVVSGDVDLTGSNNNSNDNGVIYVGGTFTHNSGSLGALQVKNFTDLANERPALCAITPGCMSLPVTWLDFSAHTEHESVTLNWSTASEKNNSHFEIHRSVNIQDWELLGQVDGNGNSNQVVRYQYVDEHPRPAINYYRIKQIDFDGKHEFSELISSYVSLNWVEKIYPNPNSGVFTVMLSQVPESLQSEDIKLVNAYGQSFEFDYQLSYNKLEIMNENLPVGIYYVNVLGQTIEQLRIVIHR